MTRVLVIDDDAAIRLVVKVNLHAAGVEVAEADDGPSGMRAALDHELDLIFLDIQMPGTDGIQVAQALRDHPDTLSIPIVFLSPRLEFCACVRTLGFHDVAAVHEPFNPVELWPFVERLMSSARDHSPSTFSELQPLWALREIATTPNDTSVDEAVARWRAQWHS
jgi:two-component system, NtrC family, response regulator